MTLDQFNLLEQEEQQDVLWEDGVHIGTRSTVFHMVVLYQIDEFYVEAYYNVIDNYIAKLRSFSHLEWLNPYLEEIDISELLVNN